MKKSTTYTIDGICLADLIKALDEIQAEQGPDAVITGADYSLDCEGFGGYRSYISRFTITLVDELED